LGTRAKRPRPAKSTPGVKPRNTPTAERREGPAAEETQRPAEALPLVELRWIVEALRSLRDRTAETADFVARESRHGDPARQRRIVMLGQRQLWRLAGELLGAMEWLAWTADDLAGSPRPAEAAEGGETAAASALISTLQCVVVDSLNPALASLIAACQSSWREDDARE